jgi:hypothetical protein
MSSIPQPFYNPQIAPTSTFTQPFVAAPTPVQVQLGQGLEDIGPAFMNFSTTLASFVGRQVSIQNEENVKQGQAKIMASRKTFKQLVDSGKIDPAANPWEAYGAAQADAIMAARDFSAKLRADYEAQAAKDPMFMDSVGSFDTFSNERIRQAASAGVQNPVWVNTFLEEIDPDVSSMAKSHVVEVGRLRRKKMTEGLAVGMAADVSQMMTEVSALPIGEVGDAAVADFKSSQSAKIAAKELQARIDNVAQTIGGESANEVAINAIMSLRVEYGDDPRISDVAGMIKTPGGRLVDTERYKASVATKQVELDQARGRMTIEKRAWFKDYLGSFFTSDRIRSLKGTEIIEGKGFPAWEEIEGDVRRRGVSSELYEELRSNYEAMKAGVIREEVSKVANNLAYEAGVSLGQRFANASGNVSELVRLAETYDIKSIVADGENQLRIMRRAYGLKDGDAPKTISEDEVRRAAIETAYQSLPRDPSTGVPTQEGLTALVQIARAMDAKYLPSVTPMMRTAVSAFNQPNADATQIPPEVMTAINLYEVAAASNETEMLGLPENERQFLEVVSTLRRSGTGLTDAVRRANQLTTGSGKSFKMEEPKREEIAKAAQEWNDEGTWFGNVVSPDATGMGTVEQTIRDVSYANQLSGMGISESISRAKEYVARHAVVFEGTVIVAPRTSKTLGNDEAAWGAARNAAVKLINARVDQLNAQGRDLPKIDPDDITFAPRSSSRDNVIFDLIYKDGGNSVDLRYGGQDLGAGLQFSFTVDELGLFVNEKSKADYARPISPEDREKIRNSEEIQRSNRRYR